MSGTNEKKDELSELIDSLDIDSDLNRKMDVFTQYKRRWDIQKNKEEKKEDTQEIIYSKGDTIRSIGDTIQNTIQGPLKSSGTKTIVFEQPSSTKNVSGTVIIGEKEIQNFIEEENVAPHKNEPEEEVETSDTKKKILYILLTVFLGLLLGIGIYSFANGIFNREEEPSQQIQEYYSEIKTWAESYDTLTDEEKANIVELEAKFNKLDDDQKAEINSILKEKTGSNFDELLAGAKSGEQTSKKNNNTELAEQKAELKNQMSALESQLSQAESDLNTAKDEMDSAQADFDNWTSEVDKSGTALSEAKNACDSAESIYKDPEGEQGGSDEAYKAYQEALETLNNAQNQYNSDYANYTNSYDVLQEKQINYQNAQSTYDSLYAQYSDLNAQLEALDS